MRNPYVDFGVVNDIIIAHGIQKAVRLLRDAFEAEGNMSLSASPNSGYPPELKSYRKWVSGFSPNQAHTLYCYAQAAGSVAYRYLRKKRRR